MRCQDSLQPARQAWVVLTHEGRGVVVGPPAHVPHVMAQGLRVRPLHLYDGHSWRGRQRQLPLPILCNAGHRFRFWQNVETSSFGSSPYELLFNVLPRCGRVFSLQLRQVYPQLRFAVIGPGGTP